MNQNEDGTYMDMVFSKIDVTSHTTGEGQSTN